MPMDEILGFAATASFAASSFVYPLASFAAPIHYDIFGVPDLAWQHGAWVYPLILTSMVSTFSALPSAARPPVCFTGLFVLGLQAHALHTSLHGPAAASLPWLLVPSFLLLLALLFVVSALCRPAEKPRRLRTDAKPAAVTTTATVRSPRSPRALIRKIASDDDQQTTPVSGSRRR